MFKKIFILILFMSFLSGCGFAPIYSSDNKVNFSVGEMSFDGDWETNNFIKSFILKNSSKSVENVYNLIIKSDYSKRPITKDSTGKTSSYEAVMKVEFFIKSKNLENNFLLQEKFLMENFTDELDEKKFETTVKENLANIIVNKFKIKLVNLK
jgi:outer membrane lipopolysaccharide assembly protein LptE/RlpB